ncbi:MAG: lipopolysaccharide biosynthesis protein [Candidatus Omnitrophica bacterium]|nr:lipopolysaccharide biosynthesis protein [Candidatus Omnitrophota bacterium]MDD5670469.1 lipopolysaccharide biosynthesis protein [Candidatus Omnitrophota bacterium]
MTSLKHKTVSGVKWQMVSKITQKAISVGTFAVLARILEPSTFGLFALAFVAIDGFHIFKSFGLDSALIQRKDRIDDAAHTADFIVLGMGFLMAIVCFLIAPLAAYFFHNHDVLSVIQVLAVIFVISSFSKIPGTLLAKQMRFGVLSVIDLIATIVNSFFAISFSILTPTVWSLVFAYLIKQIVTALLYRIISGYRFKWYFDYRLAKELLHFGKYMMGLGWLGYLNENIANISIGKILGALDLGYYALANNIGNFINTHFTYLLEGVMFPAYSSIQHDREEVLRVYLKTTKYVSLLALPFSVLLIFLPKELVLTLYGEKWLAIVPLLRIFGIVQLFAPVSICSGSVFLGCGKPEYNYRIALYAVLIKIPLLIIFTKYYGLIGAALVDLIILCVLLPLNMQWVRSIIPFNYLKLFKQFIPTISCAIVMIAVVAGVKAFILPLLEFQQYLTYLINLVLPSMIGLGAYLMAFSLIDRAAIREIKQLIVKTNSEV